MYSPQSIKTINRWVGVRACAWVTRPRPVRSAQGPLKVACARTRTNRYKNERMCFS